MTFAVTSCLWNLSTSPSLVSFILFSMRQRESWGKSKGKKMTFWDASHCASPTYIKSLSPVLQINVLNSACKASDGPASCHVTWHHLPGLPSVPRSHHVLVNPPEVFSIHCVLYQSILPSPFSLVSFYRFFQFQFSCYQDRICSFKHPCRTTYFTFTAAVTVIFSSFLRFFD